MSFRRLTVPTRSIRRNGDSPTRIPPCLGSASRQTSISHSSLPAWQLHLLQCLNIDLMLVRRSQQYSRSPTVEIWSKDMARRTLNLKPSELSGLLTYERPLTLLSEHTLCHLIRSPCPTSVSRTTPTLVGHCASLTSYTSHPSYPLCGAYVCSFVVYLPNHSFSSCFQLWICTD
jgi:hypothetical protein